MSDRRKFNAMEMEAKYAADIFALRGQGYTLREVARLLDLTPRRVENIIARTAALKPLDDVAHWRKGQLLHYERLKQACIGVLEANHVVVSNGVIVREAVLDDEGKPVWDPVYGPDGEPITNDKGEIRVEQRKVALLDHAAVLEAAAELRKIEVEISKLLGTQMPVKQALEVQHVDYTINGVDVSKVTGANLGAGDDEPEGKTGDK